MLRFLGDSLGNRDFIELWLGSQDAVLARTNEIPADLPPPCGTC